MSVTFTLTALEDGQRELNEILVLLASAEGLESATRTLTIPGTADARIPGGDRPGGAFLVCDTVESGLQACVKVPGETVTLSPVFLEIEKANKSQKVNIIEPADLPDGKALLDETLIWDIFFVDDNGMVIETLSNTVRIELTAAKVLVGENGRLPDDVSIAVLHSGSTDWVILPTSYSDEKTSTGKAKYRFAAFSENFSFFTLLVPAPTPPVVIGFKPYTYTVVEGAGEVTLTVEVISGVLPETVTLSYTTMDDSATDPGDYIGGSGLSIPTLSALVTSVTFRITIEDDMDPESTERFFVELSGMSLPGYVTLDPATATVTIMDDDIADPIVIGFRPYTYTVDESVGDVELTVEVISGVLTEEVMLSYTTVEDSATDPEDYIGGSVVSIPTLSALVTSVTFRITIVDDMDPESMEQFFVDLGSVMSLPAGVTLDPATATVTITDTDPVVIPPVVIGFRPYTYTVDESVGDVELTVEVISGVLTEEVMLSYTTVEDSATDPEDYIGGSVVSIPTLSALVTSVTFRITIVDDMDPESMEQFFVDLGSVMSLPGYVTLDPATATVTIMDDDIADPIVIGFRPYTYTVDESVGDVELTVEVISGVLPETVTLSYTTVDDSATDPEDYIGGSVVSIPALSALVTSVTFRITIVDDMDPEPMEQFFVELGSVMSLPAGVTLDPATATVTITDTDPVVIPPVVIGFRPYTYTVDEGDGDVELTVEVISGVLPETVTLSYTTVEDSATDPEDYIGGSVVSIPALSALVTSVPFRITIVDDMDPESMEQFFVDLGSVMSLPAGVTLAQSRATVTITDTDTVVIPPVVIGFRPYTYTVDESVGDVELTVEVISGVLTQDVTLTYTTMDDSAVAPGDYTGANGGSIPTLSELVTSVPFRIRIVDDMSAESTEQFFVDLDSVSLPAGVTLDPSRSRATVTITDTDTVVIPPVVIGFRPYTYTVDESVGDVELTVEVISGVLPETVTLSYTTVEDSATDPEDYIGGSVVSIPALSALVTSVTFRITIVDDMDPESMEQFFVDLGSVMSLPAGVTLDPATATVTITDTDPVVIPPVVIGFRPYTYTVDESVGDVELTVEVISGVLTEEVMLSYTTVEDSATDPEDYIGGSVVSIPTLSALVTSVTFRITIVDDMDPESMEQFFVDLGSVMSLPAGVTLAQSRATVTITDTDPVPVVIGFRPDAYEVDESAGVVTVTVEVISGVLTQEVMLSYTTRDDSAVTGSDYTHSMGTVTLSSGMRSDTFSVPILDDNTPESTEQFFVDLSSVSLPAGVTLDPAIATVTITDTVVIGPPPPVMIGFVPYTYTVSESVGFVTLNVEVISGVLPESVDLRYQTSAGSAVAGSDYEDSMGTVTLSSSDTRKTFTVRILDDNTPESTEQFFVDLVSVMSLPAGVTLDPSRATVTITDTVVIGPPPPVMIGFVPYTYTVSESVGFVTLNVEVISGVLPESVDLRYQTSAGSAVAGSDYEDSMGTVTLSSSDTRKTFTVRILDDNTPESTEQFFVDLGSVMSLPAGVTLAPSRATVTITDTDTVVIPPVVIGFRPYTYTVDESVGDVELTVEVISGVLTEEVMLSYTTVEDSATDPEDYIGGSVVSIPTLSALVTSVTFRITIVDDMDPESMEQFFVDLGSVMSLPAGVTLAPSRATVTIMDGDAVLPPPPPEATQIEFVVLTATIDEGEEYQIELQLVDDNGDPLIHSQDVSATLEVFNAGRSLDLNEFMFSSPVTILAGQITGVSRFISVDDIDVELDERVTLRISEVNMGLSPRDNRDMFTITVRDDDAEIGFDQDMYTVDEDAGGVTITIDIDGRLTEDVTLNYEIDPGTASETEDYVAPLTREIPLSSGATSATLFVEIMNDDLYENADTFSVRLVEPAVSGLPYGVELATGMTETTVTITNDDEIEIGFVEGMYTWLENQGQGTVQVRRTGSEIAPGVEVAVYYTTTVLMGDSLNPMDLSGYLMISSSRNIYNINIGITDDNEFNFVNDEYIMTLELLGMNDGLSLKPGRGTTKLTVLTDDVVRIGFSMTEYEVSEASGTVELEVRVLHNTIAAGVSVVVRYLTTPGSATSDLV